MKPEVMSLDDLAVFGGQPAFNDLIHVGRPNIGDRKRVLELIEGALDRRWLTNGGQLVAQFEQRIADLTGAEHCIAVTNATVGLQLVARAMNLTGEVIVPAFTFIATAHALSWIGLEPRFCEIDPVTHTIATDSVASAITDRTTAILGVHLWGRPCDVESLTKLARQNGLHLFFDAAQALACWQGDRPVGTFGEAEVFSFHATKVAGAGEGGAITTNDAGLAGRLRLMRNFGFSTYDTVTELGTNGKMGELPAALGLASLEHLEEFVAANRRNHELYRRELESVPGLRMGIIPEGTRSNCQYVVVEVDQDQVARDDLITVLHAENVLARRYFFPGCHRQEPYRKSALRLPVTDGVCSSVLVLPTGPALEREEVAVICSLIRLAASMGDELRSRLGAMA